MGLVRACGLVLCDSSSPAARWRRGGRRARAPAGPGCRPSRGCAGSSVRGWLIGKRVSQPRCRHNNKSQPRRFADTRSERASDGPTLSHLAVRDHVDAGLLAHLHHRQAVGERVRGEARCMCGVNGFNHRHLAHNDPRMCPPTTRDANANTHAPAKPMRALRARRARMSTGSGRCVSQRL